MDNRYIGQKILEKVGGPSNINRLTHCATRLRFSLHDDSIVDEKSIESLSGVYGTAKNSEQFQVIVGADKVEEIFKIINGTSNNMSKESPVDKVENKDKKFSFKNIILKGLNVLSEILTPLVPALAASGMLKVILLLLVQLNVTDSSSSTYQILNVFSDAIFYFLPVITAYLAAQYFKTNAVLAVVFAGVLIHPAFVSLFESGDPVQFLGLTLTKVSYNGTLIPSILMVWVMSKVEPAVDKISPKMIKVFFKPLVIMLIIAPLTLLLIGPFSVWIGNGFGSITTAMYDRFGWLAVGVLGALLPFSVLTGLNRALTPISIQIFTELGYEPLFRTAYIPGNMTQGAAALAVAFKTKNKEFKQVAFSASLTTLLSGITEPSLFGVLVKVKKPLIATTIAGFVAGAYAGIMGVNGYALAVPGFLSIPMFIGENPMNLVHALITYAISIVLSFVLTLLIGFDDIPVGEEEYSSESKKIEA